MAKQFQVGGRNWVSESESPKFRPYQGASITHSIVQVPEWNAKMQLGMLLRAVLVQFVVLFPEILLLMLKTIQLCSLYIC
ncbi:hypothetical protein [Enterococcus gallinarum]|uniref:hypothetical protein n=1 Tax=Enterococcus gallinarum TaxID=1353 RepID=UPI000E1C2145|nr:hypothetical protein [Enterococcus gallinarum]